MLTPGGVPLRTRSIPDELERRPWSLLIAIRESDPSSTSPCQEEYEVIDLIEEIMRPRYPDKGALMPTHYWQYGNLQYRANEHGVEVWTTNDRWEPVYPSRAIGYEILRLTLLAGLQEPQTKTSHNDNLHGAHRAAARFIPNGPRIMAGLNENGESARLYGVRVTSQTGSYWSKEISKEEWIAVLDSLGAKPGEMLLVSLYRQEDE